MSCNWQMITLDKIVTHQKGFAFKSKDYIDFGVPVVRVSNFTMDSIDCSDLKYVDQSVAQKNASVQLVENDVVIATVGSWPTNPASVVGKTVYVPKNVDGSLLNQNAVRLRVKSNEESDQLFLYYLLKNKDFSDYIVSTAQGSANQASITLKDIYGYEFAYPEPHHRKVIAGHLSSIDRKITINTQTNQTLEEMAQAIFKSWFVDFDPVKAKMNGEQPEGMDEATASLFPEKLVESELGLIPEGWCRKSIYDICNVIYGAPFKSKQFNTDALGIPLVRIRDLKNEAPGVYTEEVHPKGYLIKNGDIVVGMDGEFRAYLWGGENAWMNQRICSFQAKDSYSNYMVKLFIEPSLRYFENTATATTVIHLGKKDIDTFTYLHPNEELLYKFSQVVEGLARKIVMNKLENISLSKLRDTLLPKLLSGEIELAEKQEN